MRPCSLCRQGNFLHTSKIFQEKYSLGICTQQNYLIKSSSFIINNNINNNIMIKPFISICALRRYSTSVETPSSQKSSNIFESNNNDNNNNDNNNNNELSNSTLFRTVRLHNMPRTWMHEDVIEFIHQIAEHAGIEPPLNNNNNKENNNNNKEEEDMISAIPLITSPFIAKMHIPFGRRTGIIYGTPLLQLTSNNLVNYLIRDLTFDPDDYRNRIYFTEVLDNKNNNNNNNNNNNKTKTNIIEDEELIIKLEQQEALETLELDRYLLAPDLLYDIAKMRQKRLVTRRSKLLLETFADEDNDNNNNNNNKEKDENMDNMDIMNEKETIVNSKSNNNNNNNNNKRLRYVGEYKNLGRGSVHSIPLAMPYVQGRRGTS